MCVPPSEGRMRDEHTTTVQRGVQAEAALEALRGDETIPRVRRVARRRVKRTVRGTKTENLVP